MYKITKIVGNNLLQHVTLLSVTDGNGHKTTYQYDNNNNLTNLTDALNRQKSYTYNDNDQVTTVQMPNMTFTYAYDENGNTTSVVRDTKPLKTYGYTTESNLLANYTLGLFTQNYGYDDKERINQVTTSYDKEFKVIEATTYKENSDDIDHIQYAVDNNVLHDYQSDIDGTNNKTTLTLNTDLWKQVSQMNDANLLGSITYTTKALQPFEITYDYTKNGNISTSTVDGQVSNFAYDAYGNILTVEGAVAKENPIRYAGYYYDDETKNYYLQARYYNPANGAFLALDTHPGDEDEPLSQNGYSYANGNPVINIDHNGEKSWKWVRKEALARAITTIVGLAIGAHGIYTAARILKTYTKKKVVKLKIVKYITKFGVYKNLAVQIAAYIVNGIINVLGSSIGGVAVWILTRYFFTTVTKYAKKYVYWGPKVKITYINFGKRK
ncbi:RHS repeat-associated core domain-containing protein [Rummeliibacillus sp. POC4]|uniref:RHS repeat-associated core domain-containing protein n=1 Tax=Rummeliibacillus sp. POC4 TaxID=2305899 RepID=UPI001314F5C0|nr:RHS repeat-associated core domain-containing protein [Rummeliibacillus sp. POC4]